MLFNICLAEMLARKKNVMLGIQDYISEMWTESVAKIKKQSKTKKYSRAEENDLWKGNIKRSVILLHFSIRRLGGDLTILSKGPPGEKILVFKELFNRAEKGITGNTGQI